MSPTPACAGLGLARSAGYARGSRDDTAFLYEKASVSQGEQLDLHQRVAEQLGYDHAGAGRGDVSQVLLVRAREAVGVLDACNEAADFDHVVQTAAGLAQRAAELLENKAALFV